MDLTGNIDAAPARRLLLAWSGVFFLLGPGLRAETLRERAVRQYYGGDITLSAESFEKAAEAGPDEALSRLDAGIVYRDLEKHEESYRHFALASDLRPKDPHAAAALGWAALRAKHPKEAEAAFRAAIKIEPANEQALLGLARLKLDAGRPGPAIGTLNGLLKAHPNNAIAHVLKGRAYEEMSSLNSAISSYKRALGVDSTYITARLLIAPLYKRLRKWEAAWYEYSKVAVIDPRNKLAKGEARALRKRFKTAPREVLPTRRVKKHLPVVLAKRARKMSEIRVAIGTTSGGNPAAKREIAFLGSGRFEIVDPENGDKRLAIGPAGKSWLARRLPRGRAYEIVDHRGGRVLTFKTVVAVRPLNPKKDSTIFQRLNLADGTAWQSRGDRQLKGTVEIRARGWRGLYLINDLSLEDYIYGVINEEMPVKFPLEALKAQAVIARNHALTSKKLARIHRRFHYDLCDGQHCQVFSGVTGESAKGRRAVDETRGLVLRHNGKIAYTPYSSNCGGHTQDSGEVKGWSALPYLKGRKDAKGGPVEVKSPWKLDRWLKSKPKVYCNVPDYLYPAHFRWSRILPANDLGDRIRLRTKRFGLLREVRILKRSASGNVNEVLFRGTRGRYVLDRENRIRGIFGLSSVRNTMFTIEAERNADGVPTEFYVHGGGWGHNIGLCQYGAVGRALDKQGYREILAHYFPGTRVESLGY